MLPDIVLAFLRQEHVDEPAEYIKQICFEDTGFLPVYYFMHLSRLKREEIIAEIESVVSRSKAKNKLLERLKIDNRQSLNKPLADTGSARKKKDHIEAIKKQRIDINISGKELEYCLQSIRMLKIDEVKNNFEYIRGLLRNWFNRHYSSGTRTIADNLRRAICWVDEALYGAK